jgi:UDP-N-acetylmuramyl pentapeptide phosphotransferase/UDP-N-acetylglucosamine-1-phosphate transferase
MIDFVISIVLSFIITYLITPYFIKFLESAKIVGIDVHKANKQKIAEMGAASTYWILRWNFLLHICKNFF